MKFAPPSPTPRGFARRVPPAIFPSIMGLFGLGLALRRAAASLGEPSGTGQAAAEMILGAVVLLYVTGLVSYAAKLTRRPSVLPEELRTMPGRLGLSAFVTCFYLLATTLSPYLPDLARGVFWAGLALHLALIALILQTFATGPAEQRRFSPAGHLYFVSPVVGAVTAALAGYSSLAFAITLFAVVLAGVLWAWGADRLIREGMSPPLRPLLALHLAPAAVIGLAAALLGLLGVAHVMAALSGFILAALIIGVRKITAGGFSALWGAFTFPLAATASLWLVLGDQWRIPGLAALVLSVLVIPPIAYRVVKMWMSGQLAIRTNAAAA